MRMGSVRVEDSQPPVTSRNKGSGPCCCPWCLKTRGQDLGKGKKEGLPGYRGSAMARRTGERVRRDAKSSKPSRFTLKGGARCSNNLGRSWRRHLLPYTLDSSRRFDLVDLIPPRLCVDDTASRYSRSKNESTHTPYKTACSTCMNIVLSVAPLTCRRWRSGPAPRRCHCWRTAAAPRLGSAGTDRCRW